MALIKCKECGKKISDKAKTCIHCGYTVKKTKSKKKRKYNKIVIWYIIIAVLVLMIIVGVIKKEKEHKEQVDRYNDNLDYNKNTSKNVVDNRTPKEKFVDVLLSKGFKTTNNTIYTLYYNSSMWVELDFNKGLFYKSSSGALSMLTQYYYKDQKITFTYKYGSYWANISWNLNNGIYNCESSINGWCNDYAEKYVDGSMTDIKNDFNKYLQEANVSLNDIK